MSGKISVAHHFKNNSISTNAEKKKLFCIHLSMSLSLSRVCTPVLSVSGEPIGVLLVLGERGGGGRYSSEQWCLCWMVSGRSRVWQNRLDVGWTSGDPHAGPLTAGSEDTALWSRLGRRGGQKTTSTFLSNGSKKEELSVPVAAVETYLASSLGDMSSRGPLGSSTPGRHFSLLKNRRINRSF